MKGIGKKLMVGVICCSLLLTTACSEKGGESQGDNVARGRYVETKFTLPAGAASDFYLMPDESLNLLFVDDYGNAPNIYNSADFTVWQPVETGWYENLAEGELLSHIAYDGSGTLHVLTMDDYLDENGKITTTFKLYRVGADGRTIENIPVDFYRAPGIEVRSVVDNFEILANGDFLIGQPFDDAIVQYGNNGALKKLYEIGDVASSFAVNGNSFAVLDQGGLRIYDGVSQEIKEQMNLEDYINSDRIYYGKNDILYAQNSNGLYRLNPGGSLWEKIIDGELCSMSLPELNFTEMVELENGDFYMLAGGDRINSFILGYHYDPDIATLPEHELVIYTLQENDTVRLAAVEYQKLHPDTRINIQRAYSDSSVTSGDLLRALNTELLNGKGPDILILDGMNVEAYIDKGILLDLAEMVDALTGSREMVEPVLRTYEKDGRICALPVKYHMPVMIAEEPVAAEIETLDDLARYALEHPERGILGDLSPETLLEALLPSSTPTWITGSAIDRERLSAFLEAVHTIMNTGAESYYDENETFFNYTQTELYHYAYGRSHVYLGPMKGIYDTANFHALLEPWENISPLPEPRRNSIITYMPGQQEKSYVPVTITGINVNSKQVEKAQDFLQLMLSDSVQYDGGEATGFAVSVTAQEEEARFTKDYWVYAGGHYKDDEMLLAKWPSVELQQQVIRLAQGVENDSYTDRSLQAMIVDAAKGYLTGEKSLDQAIADVEEATKIYLAE